MRVSTILGLACVCVLALTSVSAGTTSPRQSYEGHAVLRVTPDNLTEEQREALKEVFEHKEFGINRWAWNDLMVSPDSRAKVESYLAEHDLPFTVAIPDVGTEIRREEDQFVQNRLKLGGNVLKYTQADYFSAYHTLDDIHTFTNNLAQQYPKLVTEQKIGFSYGGLPIYAYVVSTTPPGDKPKPAVYLEFGIHAREWIAPATGTWMFNQFVTQYGTDPHITKVLNALDYIFVPVVNVDGYKYTWTNDRMWRKTIKPNQGSRCIGTDPNRNWDNHWCIPGAGGSRDPCSESYCGPSPFSEMCVQAVSGYAGNNTNIVAFVDFHSYSQLWMTPYGYTSKVPANNNDQQAMTKQAVAALTAVHNTKYQSGPIYTTIYPAAGSSADWAYDNTTHIQYSFAVELRDTGRQGFLLDASQIIPSGQETIQAILAMGDYLIAHPKVSVEKELHFGDNVHQYARRNRQPKKEESQEERRARNRKHGNKH